MKNLIIFLCLILAVNTLYSQKPRIGIYDSRGVAVAYYQSSHHQEDLNKLLAEYNEAKGIGDTVLARKLNDRVGVLQMIAHDKGFGKGTVTNILDRFNKEMDALANAEKVIFIVSKWEIYSADEDLEFVDLTEKVAAIVNPSDNVKKFIKELENHAPLEDAFFIEEWNLF